MREDEAKQTLRSVLAAADPELELEFIRSSRPSLTSPRIYVPRELLSRSDSWLTGWLLHEVQHRRWLPQSVERQLFWSYVATQSGLREPTKLIHFFCDLLIDTKLAIQESERYREFLAERAPTLDYLDGEQASLYLDISQMAKDGTKPSELKVREAYEAIFEGAIDNETRLGKLSQHLADQFRGSTPFTTDIPPGLELSFEQKDDLLRSMLYADASPAQIQEFFDKIRIRHTERERRQLLLTANKLYLYQLVEVMSPILRGLRTADFPVLETWSPGDDPRELSVVDTIRIYGILIPGVFAIRRREIVRGRRAKSVCILMDCSGSTGLSQTIAREREAAFGLVQAARQRSDIVSFIPFSTDVDLDNSVLNSRDYEGIEEAILKVEPMGFSNITAPLSLALKVADLAGRQVAFVMTDGRVWDSEKAMGMINTLSEYGKVVFFIFGTGVSAMPEEAKDLMRGFPMYECDPKEPIVDQALQEYLG